MKKEYAVYAQRLDSIGDLIIEISDSMKELDDVKGMSNENIKKYKEDMNETIKRFESIEESIADLTVPSVIQSEHQDLLQSFGDFVQSIKDLNESFKITNNDVELNESDYFNGLSLQRKSVDKIEEAAASISEGLSKAELTELIEKNNSQNTHSDK